jgi:hypothetical protein
MTPTPAHFVRFPLLIAMLRGYRGGDSMKNDVRNTFGIQYTMFFYIMFFRQEPEKQF